MINYWKWVSPQSRGFEPKKGTERARLHELVQHHVWRKDECWEKPEESGNSIKWMNLGGHICFLINPKTTTGSILDMTILYLPF